MSLIAGEVNGVRIITGAPEPGDPDYDEWQHKFDDLDIEDDPGDRWDDKE